MSEMVDFKMFNIEELLLSEVWRIFFEKNNYNLIGSGV
jgi:hypothetical protein